MGYARFTPDTLVRSHSNSNPKRETNSWNRIQELKTEVSIQINGFHMPDHGPQV